MVQVFANEIPHRQQALWGELVARLGSKGKQEGVTEFSGGTGGKKSRQAGTRDLFQEKKRNGTWPKKLPRRKLQQVSPSTKKRGSGFLSTRRRGEEEFAKTNTRDTENLPTKNLRGKRERSYFLVRSLMRQCGSCRTGNRA